MQTQVHWTALSKLLVPGDLKLTVVEPNKSDYYPYATRPCCMHIELPVSFVPRPYHLTTTKGRQLDAPLLQPPALTVSNSQYMTEAISTTCAHRGS